MAVSICAYAQLDRCSARYATLISYWLCDSNLI
uniref:Uncharacterized protein n=1 Tax=Arundo donax TaxID=35708 RepID=A0A0A9A7C6_ARUDO